MCLNFKQKKTHNRYTKHFYDDVQLKTYFSNKMRFGRKLKQPMLASRNFFLYTGNGKTILGKKTGGSSFFDFFYNLGSGLLGDFFSSIFNLCIC